jgi:hypothetical protein
LLKVSSGVVDKWGMEKLTSEQIHDLALALTTESVGESVKIATQTSPADVSRAVKSALQLYRDIRTHLENLCEQSDATV